MPNTMIAALDADEMEWQRMERERDAQLRTWGTKYYGPKVSDKLHPLSYRPDLPTFGFTDAELVKLSKEDKAAYAKRPLVMREYHGSDKGRTMSSAHKLAKASARLTELHITREA